MDGGTTAQAQEPTCGSPITKGDGGPAQDPARTTERDRPERRAGTMGALPREAGEPGGDSHRQLTNDPDRGGFEARGSPGPIDFPAHRCV